MTDRIKGFIVTLEEDIREDDAEQTIAAIKQIKGVISVKPMVSDVIDLVAYERARRELTQKLWDVL